VSRSSHKELMVILTFVSKSSEVDSAILMQVFSVSQLSICIIDNIMLNSLLYIADSATILNNASVSKILDLKSVSSVEMSTNSLSKRICPE